jgi:acetyl esterase/lipase
LPLDPRVQRFLEVLAVGSALSVRDQTVAERRASLAELLRLGAGEEAVGALENSTLPGPAGQLPIRIYSPLGAVESLLPGLIYFHGGGLVAGSLDTHEGIARTLSNASRCRLIAVDYRLGPEHRFPAAVEDAIAASQYVARHAAAFGIDRARLGICGDSAGATLAAVVCQGWDAGQTPPLAVQVLLCPILDHSRQSASRLAFAQGYLVGAATLAHDLLHYLPPSTPLEDPRISPLCAADLKAQPPAIIHTAEYDPLRDEGEAYAERLQLAGGRVQYECHAGMVHLFYGLGKLVPRAQAVLTHVGQQIQALLGANSVQSPRGSICEDRELGGSDQ